jgi:hypothetical protein
MHDKPDAEVSPPLFIKALGLLVSVGFAAMAVTVARDALSQSVTPTSVVLVLVLVGSALTFAGLLRWRTRLYVRQGTIAVERRGYFRTVRSTFAAGDVELTLDRNATWGLLAKATVPRFVVKTRDGEVLLLDQWMGVEDVAESFAKKSGQPLRDG